MYCVRMQIDRGVYLVSFKKKSIGIERANCAAA
jgi:hypothetical protein